MCQQPPDIRNTATGRRHNEVELPKRWSEDTSTVFRRGERLMTVWFQCCQETPVMRSATGTTANQAQTVLPSNVSENNTDLRTNCNQGNAKLKGGSKPCGRAYRTCGGTRLLSRISVWPYACMAIPCTPKSVCRFCRGTCTTSLESRRSSVDISAARGRWTSGAPSGHHLSPPAAALRLEKEQIAKLGLRPMVSLTDHDDVEAGFALQVATEPAAARPVESVHRCQAHASLSFARR